MAEDAFVFLTALGFLLLVVLLVAWAVGAIVDWWWYR